MGKIWSISTTVRNPDRIYNFLKVLSCLEGKVWNEDIQKIYQVLLIRFKLYKPKKYKNYIENNEITNEKAIEIFEKCNYVDGPQRGRQSINILKKLKLVKINNDNEIIITKLGKNFIDKKVTIGDLLPNLKLDSKSVFCDISPFVATLEFLVRLDQKSKERTRGINNYEFKYYLMTTNDYSQISEYVDKLIEARQNKQVKLENEEFVRNNYDNFKHAEDYFDSIYRYFKKSDLLIISFNNIKLNYNKIDDILNIIKKYYKNIEKENEELEKLTSNSIINFR
ncbi:AlwI family type II restriction endonuclease [Clostridium beijerinckii]|uniref:AlwI family type II restriction endonuclease n=1 Tax=Clostridium beijerinckii TaxID=1520 RepID=UPI00232E4585|nr:AlwI family type II restriction endonuclease [Clostridium beijerinckii]